MTRVTVNDHVLEIVGHAHTPDGNRDPISCACISYAAQSLIDGLRSVAGLDVDVIVEPSAHGGHVKAKFRNMNDAGRVLIKAAEIGMDSISDDIIVNGVSDGG